MPPPVAAVSVIESPLSTVPAGTPVMATVGMLNTTSPGVRGGMEASAGDVSGTGTKPAATRLATSNPAAPPISLPIAVSSPAS